MLICMGAGADAQLLGVGLPLGANVDLAIPVQEGNDVVTIGLTGQVSEGLSPGESYYGVATTKIIYEVNVLEKIIKLLE